MQKLILFIMGLVCAAVIQVQAQPGLQHNITGTVLSAKDGTALAGASVILQKSGTNAVTDAKGKFSILLASAPDTLVVSHIGYGEKRVFIQESPVSPLTIRLEASSTRLQGITISTGYQQIPKERATGSFDFIDQELLNRSTGSNILDRIENLTPSILFNHGDASGTDPLLIRGRTTIFSNAAPLIVLDNFPYDGNINNINPNDIKSITVLKDAAAASIWGARAGNGVIVITTKKGKTKRPKVEFSSNVTVTEKPDLYNINQISPGDYIDLEEFLYGKGYYVNAVNSVNHSPISPVVQLLFDRDAGMVSPSQANTMIESMKDHDVRSDIQKYFYRTGIDYHHALNVSGNSDKINYFMSAGWDKGLPIYLGQKNERLTLRSKNTFYLTKNLSVDAGIDFTQSNNISGNNPGYSIRGQKQIYPYAKLADKNGNPLPVDLYYNSDFINKAAKDGLLDWEYKPLAEINSTRYTTKIRDNLINLAVHYHPLKSLGISFLYQYENQLRNQNSNFTDSSYFARNLINKFTQVDPSDHSLTYPIPLGGILDADYSEMTSHQGRVQINYTNEWNNIHQLAFMAGAEIRSIIISGSHQRFYGYQPNIGKVNNYLNYNTYYPQYDNKFSIATITDASSISKRTDHFISYYANASYTYRAQYTLSASARKDEANLFGVATNQKGTPLWSTGIAWALSKAKFYHVSWVPFLKLRLTYGYNGNISRLSSAYTIIQFGGAHFTDATAAILKSPPNKNLKWEQIGTLNAGMNFSLFSGAVSGTVEYYHKTGNGIMAQIPVDPTSGFDYFYGNVAGTSVKGTDVQLHANILKRKFKWQNNLIFSYSASKVTKFLMPTSSMGSLYLQTSISSINPVKGRPVFALYSFKWGGLDPETGSPIGYIQGKPSHDYPTIYSQTPLQDMIYNGPAQPVFFGAFRNTFSWNHISLSLNISYKMGYYFRTTSLDYSELFGSWNGNGDYSQRWQKPGDEEKTNVPSLVYPLNNYSDAFYDNSSILVKRADNIRLEDIRLSYNLTKSQIKQLPFSEIQMILYCSNLGVIWIKNKEDIDPYYNNAPRLGRQYSFGIHCTF